MELWTSAHLGSTALCLGTGFLHPPLWMCPYNLALTRRCLGPGKPSVDFIRPLLITADNCCQTPSAIGKHSGKLSKQTASRAQGDKLNAPGGEREGKVDDFSFKAK